MRNQLELVLTRESGLLGTAGWNLQTQWGEAADNRAALAAHPGRNRYVDAADAEDERILDALILLFVPCNGAERAAQRDIEDGIIVEQRRRTRCRR